ncbi:uncharacterized protein LOC132721361 [Ruditapes philippinarum]|uniref:uncharacterized protein LOC132721361 n=1 Tax=Ruditapes philippinarum TaxID=129788 RepID=UPI00295B480B|nr:uncharacterized protein LOC132721361 [Ruditapes philippinarum]
MKSLNMRKASGANNIISKMGPKVDLKPQAEAISPTLPPENKEVQKVKDELLQNICRIDREIALIEQQIQMKKKKKQLQEEAASRCKEFLESEEVPDMKQSTAEFIYAVNRKNASVTNNILSKMGPKVDLPLYKQPSDAPIYHDNKRNFALFKPRLILHFKKRHQARKIKEIYLAQRYDQLMQAWVKKVEKWENSPKKKAKDAKLREYFEKVFPELKRARDDKERLSSYPGKLVKWISRDGTRTGLPVYAKNDANVEQIMDGTHKQEEEDRKMRNLAVIPPMMVGPGQRSLKFVNKNGLITDCMKEYKERKFINVWTAQEKQIFKEKYLQHPKNFGLIASFLEKKNTMDCVEFYYRSKKSEHYKQNKDDDNCSISTCESVASTVIAPSDDEQMLLDNEENRDTDESGTASAASPKPLHLDDRDMRKNPKADSSRPHESSQYQMQGHDPRDMRDDPLDLRGPQSGAMNLSMRQPEGLPQASSSYSPNGGQHVGKSVLHPPNLINSTSSRLAKSPTSIYLSTQTSGSITDRTPVEPYPTHSLPSTSPCGSDLAKTASDKDLSNIAECIGSNWEMLAPFLIERNLTASVEQIKVDHKQIRQRVYYLLKKWHTQTNDPSLAHLFHSMYKASTSVTIDWNEIAYKLKVTIQDIQACNTGYQHLEQETGKQQASGETMDVEMSDYNEDNFKGIQHFEPMKGVQECRNSKGQFAYGIQLHKQGVPEITHENHGRVEGFQSSVDDSHLGMDGGQSSVDGGHIRMDVGLSSVDTGQSPVSRDRSSFDGGQRSFKNACLYDGRLLDLTQDIIENLRRENIEEIGKGSFGKVYKSESKSKDFGIHVVVKKVPLSDGLSARTIRREMITSRILHQFILPLLAAVQQPLPHGKREFWFVSPLCENGDLYEVLKHDRTVLQHDRTKQILKLNAQKRVKILLQVAVAIKYIHTAVPGVRAVIFHKDIASKNIVLDDMFNARLIDFGMAREENDMSTIAGGRLFYSHPNVGKESANESWDYYSFGVIVREMITTFGPEGQTPTHLKNMTSKVVKDNTYKDIWEYDHLENAHGKLNDIATELLRPNNWKVQGFTDNVIEELKKIYTVFGQSCILDVSEAEKGNACHSCMINTKTNQTSMNQKHSDNCSQKIEVCIACEKKSFLNPITCYCGTKLTPTIGHRWAALLVAGKDTTDTNRIKISKALVKDVKELEKLLTSLAPRVFGISKTNIRTVVPAAPDRLNDEEKLWPKVNESICYFSQRTDIDTMLIYISCHGARSNGSGDMKDFQFQLGSSPNDSISLYQFEKELERLVNIEKLIIVLDRCYPPLVRLEKRDRVYIQMNSCKQDQKAQMDNNGSLFTRFFIRGLKAKSEGKICSDNCQPCIDYWNRSKDFITIHNLYDYIKGHLNDQTPVYEPHLYDHSSNIAFYTGDRVEIQFSHKNSSKNIPLDHLKDMKELKKKLKEEFGQETDEVCIRRDTFRKDGQLLQNQVCDTIDKVMLAWVQRQRLDVTFNSQLNSKSSFLKVPL